MQHRAENLALQLTDVVNLDQGWRYIGAVRANGRQRQLEHRSAGHAHLLNVGEQHVLRVGVDHRADVSGQPARIAEREFLHRALQHLQYTVRNVFLQAQHAERRAALAGAVERGYQHVLHHLLDSRG